MSRRVLFFVVATTLAVALAGCGFFAKPERPAWRAQAENLCLAQHRVVASSFMEPRPAIDGPGICGLDHPFKVTALLNGSVALNAPETLGCPLTAALEQWLTQVVEPDAQTRFGEAVVQVDSLGSYSCRPIDNQRGEHLSEHAFGNAIDIGGFRLADGRVISVEKAWRGTDDQARAFVHEVHAGACGIFTTVLGPGSDRFHYNHIHVDLALHGNTSTGPRRYCKPTPTPDLIPAPQRRDDLPDPPPLEEDLDSVRNGVTTHASSRLALGGLDAAVPLAPIPMPNAANARRSPLVASSGAYSPRPPIDLSPRQNPSANQRSAGMRPDGAFVPEGDEQDWDLPDQ